MTRRPTQTSPHTLLQTSTRNRTTIGSVREAVVPDGHPTSGASTALALGSSRGPTSTVQPRIAGPKAQTVFRVLSPSTMFSTATQPSTSTLLVGESPTLAVLRMPLRLPASVRITRKEPFPFGRWAILPSSNKSGTKQSKTGKHIHLVQLVSAVDLLTILSSVDEAGLSAGSIAKTFLVSSPETSLANPAAWLTIVAGMFTSIGAVAPGIAVASNVAAGVFTIGAGAASFGADDVDSGPQFDSFADLSSSLGKMLEWTRKNMGAQFNRYFVDTPPNNNRERGSELARILESGVWADQDVTDPNYKDIWTIDDVKSMVQGAMISEMWNTGEVAIFKWSKDHPLAKDWGFNPCFGSESYRMDDYIACINGQNYLIVSL